MQQQGTHLMIGVEALFPDHASVKKRISYSLLVVFDTKLEDLGEVVEDHLQPEPRVSFQVS